MADANDAHEELEHLIRQLQNDEPIDQVKLEVLFAPTGPVQEVSMSSGWATEFLELAERFDAALGTST